VEKSSAGSESKFIRAGRCDERMWGARVVLAKSSEHTHTGTHVNYCYHYESHTGLISVLHFHLLFRGQAMTKLTTTLLYNNHNANTHMHQNPAHSHTPSHNTQHTR